MGIIGEFNMNLGAVLNKIVRIFGYCRVMN